MKHYAHSGNPTYLQLYSNDKATNMADVKDLYNIGVPTVIQNRIEGGITGGVELVHRRVVYRAVLTAPFSGIYTFDPNMWDCDPWMHTDEETDAVYRQESRVTTQRGDLLSFEICDKHKLKSNLPLAHSINLQSAYIPKGDKVYIYWHLHQNVENPDINFIPGEELIVGKYKVRYYINCYYYT